jgi:WD40 repeat protein
MRLRLIVSLTLITLPLLLLTLIGINRSSAQNAKQTKRVKLTVLQSFETLINSDASQRTVLALSKDGQQIYSLNSVSGDVFAYDKKSRQLKKASDSLSNVETFAVGPKHELYLAQKDSSVRIVSSDGRHRLNSFHTVYPKSIAVLGNGNVVVASPFNGKNLHLYNGQGVLLASFGDIRPFDPSQTENEFLNEGRVVVGRDDQIYYVSTYAPEPYVLRFSSEGQLLGEFQIEGEAVDLQTGFTREFLNRRGFCNSGGVTVITSATIDPETGHLWLGMNGLSTQGTVYEYDQTGTKVREFAFLLNSNNKIHNVTHVKDIVVSGDSLFILTTGGTYAFKLSDVLIADAWKVPMKTSETKSAWANPLARIAKFWEPAPVGRRCGFQYAQRR